MKKHNNPLTLFGITKDQDLDFLKKYKTLGLNVFSIEKE